MRKRPGETPQAAGRRFERFWASVFGREPTAGSGNTWRVKMDVGDGSITWSCKFTSHRSATISKEMLRECEEGVHKNGDNSIPGIAIALDDGSDIVVILKKEDFERLMSLENARYIVPSKAVQKRAISRTPSLLREDLADG
jgi:hypothetical protein